MDLVLFGCLTELGAKRDELVQKFVPRSRVGIFPTIFVHFGPFGLRFLQFWFIYDHLVGLRNSEQNGPN